MIEENFWMQPLDGRVIYFQQPIFLRQFWCLIEVVKNAAIINDVRIDS
jgi:hypothetical protein